MPRVQRRIETARRNGRQAQPQQAAATGNNNNGSIATEVGADGIPKINGCPVLDPIDCQCPKVEIAEGEGVIMTCTSEPCPFSRMPLHLQCYQMLEDNLVKRLATLGSARGWTVPQRRNNLWEKKGQALIGRFCRCRCGHGQMIRDKQALYEREKAVEKEKKKKAKKTKQLPQLQFNSKPMAAQEEKKREEGFPLSTSHHAPHPSYSTTRSRLLTDRSTASMRTIALFDSMSESSVIGESSSRYNNVFRHSDCESELDQEEFPEIYEKASFVIPAPPPPPQTKSYAATIKNELSVAVETHNSPREESMTTLVESISPQTGPQHSPDSGLHHSPGAFSQEENELGDVMEGKKSTELLYPPGLYIPSLDVSVPRTPEEVLFPELTTTPLIPRKRSLLTKLAEIRAQKNGGAPKLPLSSSTPLPSVSEDNKCGIRFNAPVRDVMDLWTATNVSQMSGGDFTATKKNTKENFKLDEISGWTPMFGTGFNIGERLMYFP